MSVASQADSKSTVSVLHICPSLHPSNGGPSRTVVQLADALAHEEGIAASLLSQSHRSDPSVPSINSAVDRCTVTTRSRFALRMGLPIRKALNERKQESGQVLLHVHGVWHPAGHWAARLSRRRGIPMILQPRGMLEPWALQHKGTKKRVAMMLFQKSDLESCAALVATAPSELQSIRTLGIRRPIAVIPNGVVFIDTAGSIEPPSIDHANRTVLFLSRIHPKKGLIALVEAWARIEPMGWRLKIAGPDEGGHRAEVEAAIRRVRVEGSVEFVGEVDGQAKAYLYRTSDLFVLPTYSENFGVVVAEALSHGLPVITTHGAPWADLEAYDCGWWIETGVEPLTHALRSAMSLTDQERRAMGDRGRQYVRRYNWETIARETAVLYRWLLGQGPKPVCVDVN